MTHGKHKHPLYKTWHNIRSRCKNPNATKYYLYGGKGISICKEWDEDFMSFFNWSLENGWEKGLTIDRIDGNLNYNSSNCRWVDYYVQNNNLSNNHVIEYKGKSQSMYAWARELDMNPKTLTERLRRGWTIERAFETNVKKRVYSLTYNGETKPIYEWAKPLGITADALLYRIRSGWDLDKAMNTKKIK